MRLAKSGRDGMTTANEIFAVERMGDTLIITPLEDLSEHKFQQIESGASHVVDLLDDSSVKNVVVDFHNTDYYGSTALGFFLKIWKRVSSREGRMTFCNLSDHEKEILTVTRLDNLWSTCGSKEEALAAMRAG
jgi:anti-anti-sigma factor